MQAAINAARGYLPANLPSNPTYRKVNPADAPILILALTSDMLDKAQHVRRGVDHPGAEALAGARAWGRCSVGGSSLPAVRVELNPDGAEQVRHRPGATCAAALASREREPPEGQFADGTRTWAV